MIVPEHGLFFIEHIASTVVKPSRCAGFVVKTDVGYSYENSRRVLPYL